MTPPTSEFHRQSALEECGALDGDADPFFRELLALAAKTCDTPVAVVSLVELDRLRFYACHGIEAEGAPREGSLCASTLVAEAPLLIRDASEDPRFAEGPLVTGWPHIRFYAGIPIELDGSIRLGSFCVIDGRPRTLNAHQVETLQVLAKAAATQFELNRLRRSIAQSSEPLCVCAWCKNVAVQAPNDEPEILWMPMEAFLEREKVLTHGICPSCACMQRAAP